MSVKPLTNLERQELEFYRTLMVKQSNLQGDYVVPAQQIWIQLHDSEFNGKGVPERDGIDEGVLDTLERMQS